MEAEIISIGDLTDERGSSRKTRIETGNCDNIAPHQKMREDLPEKQGLKLVSALVLEAVKAYERGSSRKTRIETVERNVAGEYILPMREDLPEKQGLKLCRQEHLRGRRPDERGSSRKTRIETRNELNPSDIAEIMREDLPEKQGLKRR